MITHRLRREKLTDNQDRVICDICGYERALDINEDGTWKLGEKICRGDMTVGHAYTDNPGFNFLTVEVKQ